MYEDEEEALKILNLAIDEGVNYLDTAQSYGDGKSETRYGKVLKSRRKEVFLASKTPERDYDSAMTALEGSLERLQTDHLDLFHIHSLLKEDDLAAIEGKNGVLKALYKAREEGMTRFVGMTSHTDAETMKSAIQRHDLDCVQMALNAATRTGFSTGFEKIALPAANAKNLGVIAMKITGQEQLIGGDKGKTTMRNLLHYSMGLPVASCVVGMPRPEFVKENISLARDFSFLSSSEKERIRAEVAPSAAAFNQFMMHHHDCGLSHRGPKA
jgi:predicted aldo/keto reductase-like oxidoreductase